jgi:tetratricopeptide (TPR) repeat protein
VPPFQALTQVLRDLGVAADRLPGDLESAAATYRTLLADRRMLIVLDDADSVEQVRPLLPGTRTSLVVITSRHRLRGLAAMDGAHRITLAPLVLEDAVALLDAILGGSGTAATPEHVSALAVACGRLPLALRIAAANVQDEPSGGIGDYLRRLAAQPLTNLEIDDDPGAAVRRVLDLSYGRLPVEARRLFRLLSLVPTADASLPPMAAVAGLPEPAAGRLVHCLADAHLLHETHPGRYAMHSLVRAYAAERVHADETPRARDVAVEHLLDWYLAVAAAAQALLAPHRTPREPVLRHPVPPVPFAAERHDALGFLSGERAGLAATVELAVRRGDHAVAANLAYLLAGYFQITGDGPESLAVYQHGLLAAQHLGDAFLQSSLHNSLAISYAVVRRLDDAVAHLRQARTFARAVGDPTAEAAALMNLGRAHAEQGRVNDALGAYEESLEVRRAHGLTRRMGYLLNNIGCLYDDRDEPDRALEYLDQALRTHRANGDRDGEANTLDSIGVVHLKRGRHDAAIGCFQDAMTAVGQSGDREAEGTSLHHLGAAYLSKGDTTAAVEYFRRAAEHYQHLGDRHRESISRRHLAEAYLAADHPEAASQLRRALDLRTLTADPSEEATLHRMLGELEQRAGNTAAARDHWRRSVERFVEVGLHDQAAAVSSRIAG